MWAHAPGIQCSQLADVAALGAKLEKMQALTSLELNFRYCSKPHAAMWAQAPGIQ